MLALAAIFALWGLVASRFTSKEPVSDQSARMVQEWYRYALEVEPLAEGFRPPIVARMYAYVGLAAYEAALPALGPDYQSTAQLYPELHLPPATLGETYYLPAILNACYSTMYKNFFTLALDHQVGEKRKALEASWDAWCRRETDETTFLRSKKYGEAVATAVCAWAASDSLGHQAYLHLYDRNYLPPKGEGKWAPCLDFPLPALLPHWGKCRTFTIGASDYLAKPLPPYSTQPNSIFYKHALEIYTLNAPLSSENLWIAEFWSNDQPGLTFSAPSRWISITHQVVERANPDAGKTLETYLKVGFALNDALIACWRSKYLYNLERPESYIAKVIDPEWRPIHHTPPFPAYPSGHAMIGASTCEVLTQLYGQGFAITDRSHAGRTEFKGMPRSFSSFNEMALENAFSRIPLGVHFRMDCEEGLRLGSMIGKNVGTLKVNCRKVAQAL